MSPELLRILLPSGGIAMSLISAYFDESGEHDGSPVRCVGGYLFSAENAAAFDIAWQDVLHRHRLDYFHMTDSQQGTGPYKGKKKVEIDASHREAIDLIKKYSMIGFACSLVSDQFELVHAASGYSIKSAYTYLCRDLLMGIRDWMGNLNFWGEMAYIFEAGAKHQREANGFMNDLFLDEDKRIEYRYRSHTFEDKKRSSHLQAADMLAWHWYKEYPRFVSKERKTRGDFMALLEKETLICPITSDVLRKYAKKAACVMRESSGE